MRILLRAFALVPLPILYPFGWAAFAVVYYVARWRREQVEGDVAASFPELAPAVRRRIVRDSYLHASELLMEMLWGFGASARALLARVRFENPEVAMRLAAVKQTAVLLTPHYCNWEWLFLAGGAKFGFVIDTVYQPHRIPAIDRLMVEVRSRFGGRPIPRKDFVYSVLRTAGEPHVYALIADQMPRPEEPKYWTRFLNRDTAFYVGADKIARFLDATVIYVAMRRVSRGRYSVRLEVVAEPPYGDEKGEVIMERFARRVEQAVREAPADFLWLQKRWKYPRPVDE
jgi:KDO2-lipid IV(A) lauroyltransferase